MAKTRNGVSHKKRAVFAVGPNTIHASPSPFCDPTNDERANRIPPTIEAYVKARGDMAEDDATDSIDLLTDLMHYAKREGYDFDKWMVMAQVNFNSEGEEAT